MVDIIVIDDNSEPLSKEAMEYINKFYKNVDDIAYVHLDDCKFLKELMEGEYYNK